MRSTLFLLLLPIILLQFGCGSLMTRKETETYTIVERDTLIQIEQKNAPGSRDLGIVYPSSKVLHFSREITTRDSIVERFYPNFIRLGVFESVGLIGTSKENQLGAGLFGVFPEISKYPQGQRGYKDKLFSGGYYRFGIMEWRLRWFRDAKNWSLGTCVAEVFARNNYAEETMIGFVPIYVKKRFFLFEEIPYVTVSPSFGFSFFPSQYVNLNLALEVGSLGGFNFRVVGGYLFGQNLKSSFYMRNIDADKSVTISQPYVGLGISFLDFVNKVPELYIEWKDHPHSSWNIGLLQLGLLHTNADTSIGESTTSFVRGLYLNLFPTKIVLPVLNNGFYVGTSLFNLIVFGLRDLGMGVLPFRFGYWQVILPDELSVEPFIEYNYYPSTFVHFGGRLNLKISETFNISLILGYVSGNNNRFVEENTNNDFIDFTPYTSFSRYYVGISLGLLDRIFQPEEIRYNRQRK